MHIPELSGVLTRLAKRSDDFQCIPLQDPYFLVRSVRDIKVFLIQSEIDIYGRARTQRARLDEPFLYERSVLVKDLNPVCIPIANINEAVVRNPRSGPH